MHFTRNGDEVSVDLHGMYVEDARRLLANWLSRAPDGVKELRVIHGYRNGDALLTMIRKRFKHPRVSCVLPALNPGETRLILNKSKSRR